LGAEISTEGASSPAAISVLTIRSVVMRLGDIRTSSDEHVSLILVVFFDLGGYILFYDIHFHRRHEISIG
jgi:hypothetical protein